MRAVLIVAILMTAFWAVVGGVGLTAYLAAVAARSLWDRRRSVKQAIPPPPHVLVVLMIGYACVMVAVIPDFRSRTRVPAGPALAGVVLGS
jgi:hypothetical protein